MPRLTSKELFRWSTYLGQQVAEKHPMLKQTACMSLKWREIIAYLEVIKLLNKNRDKKLIKQIDKVLIPAVQKIGQAEWPRDTLTDLAMRLGSKESVYDVIEGRSEG